MPFLMKPLTALAACLATSTACQATLLNFDTFAAVGAASYGDRVGSFGPGYGAEGGATPQVLLDFATDSGVPFSVYTAGYASLASALGHGNFNEPGRVTLTPDAGFDVVLQGFDLAGWSAGSYTNSRVRVVDSAGHTYLDTGLFTFAPNTVLHFPGQAIRSRLALNILVNDFGDLGLDNLQFSQVSSVPEPGVWALLAGGLLAVLCLRLARGRRGQE